MGNHFARKVVNGSEEYAVDPEDGLSFHYRDKCIPHLCTVKNRLFDYTARRLGPEIWDRVNKVCGEIFENGVCR